MKKKFLVGLVIGVFMFGAVGVVSATTIDFENNEGNHQYIGNYYSGDGVIFGDTWYWYPGNSNYPAHSGEYTAIGNPIDAFIDFINPVSQVSAYFNVYVYELTWQALNSSGDLLGSVQLIPTSQPTPGGMQNYSLPFENISRIVITGQNANYYNMDDLYFETSAPVPEPSTMLLLGFGLVGLVGVARKKMKK